MDTRSQHLILDAVLKNSLTSNDVDHIKKVIEENLTVVDRIEYKFEPHGETIVFILSESHFSIHTYPENKYISMDIYICNMTTDLNSIVEKIKVAVEFEKVDSRIINRGLIGHLVEEKNINMIFFVTILVAFCSIVYEFLLAQSLSTTMGNTALRYNLTIGLFIASMGFGALLYQKIISKDKFKEFVKVELILSLIGGVAPILVLVVDFLFNKISQSTGVSFFSSQIQTPLFLMNHSLIVAIGFLSGLELPLLMDMSKEFKATKSHLVLAYDYLGTLLGAILFPIIILPRFHIFTIGYVVSIINICVAFYIMNRMKIKSSTLKAITWIMLLGWALLLLFHSKINYFIMKTFYFGGGL